MRKALPSLRNQIKWFFLGTSLGYIGGASSYLPNFGFEIYPVPNIAVAFYTIIIFYAIIKHRLMDIKLVLTRAGLFLGVYAILLSIPLIMLNYTQSRLIPILIAVLLAGVCPFIYNHTKQY